LSLGVALRPGRQRQEAQQPHRLAALPLQFGGDRAVNCGNCIGQLRRSFARQIRERSW